MKVLTELQNKQKRAEEKDLNKYPETQKLLQDGLVRQETEILRNVGLDAHLNVIESHTEKMLAAKKAKEIFGEEYAIIHIDQIKELCLNYRLYFRHASLYRGSIPLDLGRALVEVNEKHNLQLDAKSPYIANKVKVLAPPKMFKNYITVADKIAAIGEEAVIELKAFRESLKRDPDPALFYDLGNDYFVHIKSWGNDFSVARRIIGYFTKTAFWLKAFMWTMIAALIIGVANLEIYLYAHMIVKDVIREGTDVLYVRYDSFTHIAGVILQIAAPGIALLAIIGMVFTLFGKNNAYKAHNFATINRWNNNEHIRE